MLCPNQAALTPILNAPFYSAADYGHWADARRLVARGAKTQAGMRPRLLPAKGEVAGSKNIWVAVDPKHAFPSWTRYGGVRLKAAVGATGGMRQEQSSPEQASSVSSPFAALQSTGLRQCGSGGRTKTHLRSGPLDPLPCPAVCR
jgi:hypothetical protein